MPSQSFSMCVAVSAGLLLATTTAGAAGGIPGYRGGPALSHSGSNFGYGRPTTTFARSGFAHGRSAVAYGGYERGYGFGHARPFGPARHAYGLAAGATLAAGYDYGEALPAAQIYAVPRTIYTPVTQTQVVPVTTYQTVQTTRIVPQTVYQHYARTCECQDVPLDQAGHVAPAVGVAIYNRPGLFTSGY